MERTVRVPLIGKEPMTPKGSERLFIQTIRRWYLSAKSLGRLNCARLVPSSVLSIVDKESVTLEVLYLYNLTPTARESE